VRACPGALHIVLVLHSADIDAPLPNYHLLHWRNPHINRASFDVLNAYNTPQLSAIISRTVPHNVIPYILAATGECRKELCLHPTFRFSYIYYVFIANDEDVRA